MLTKRSMYGVAVVEGKILVFGGMEGQKATKGVEAFSDEANALTELPLVNELR